MFTKHTTKHLSAYHHGELSTEETRRVEAHLQVCPACRNAYEEIRFGAQLAALLPRAVAPASLTVSAVSDRRITGGRRPPLQFAIPVLIVVAVSFLLNNNLPTSGPSWEVSNLRGVPRIGGTRVDDIGRLRVGEELRTDSSSEARIKIADVGQLTIDPNTRIRLLETRADEHRISLERGRLEAVTWAPPRLFFVETPSAVAVDLGCAYTLEVEDDGSSLLHVTLGLVAMRLNGRESMVPRGAFCRTRIGAGPGTPFFDDASNELMSALDFVDFGRGPERGRQLEIVLRESRPRDTLSLWHLLPRLDLKSRALVYDRMAKLVPLPGGVTREGILGLDSKMLDLWKVQLDEVW